MNLEGGDFQLWTQYRIQDELANLLVVATGVRRHCVKPPGALLAALLLAFGARLSGQTQPATTAIVRVRVADSARTGVPGADVSIIRGLNEIIGRGTTDNEGRASVSIASVSGDLQISVRKVGYSPASQFFILSNSSAAAEITLRRSVQTLEPVSVTAAEDAKRKSYHVDADLIANSPRPLFDAMDIVTKLIPDVMEGRSGKGFDCGVKYVWVNGVRIMFPPSNDVVLSRIGHVPPIPTPTLVMKGNGGSGRRQPMPAVQRVDSTVWLTLATIKPEHIEEMTYEDCFSALSTQRTDLRGGNGKSELQTYNNQSLFIVLKPGVGYSNKLGSYVIADEESKTKPARQELLVPPVPAALPAYRMRLVGVFDAVTGNPVEGAAVTDSASGTHAETTVTGTITLAFLPEGPAILRISKSGYLDERQDILISPRDSFPLTIVLGKAPPRDTLLERGQLPDARHTEPRGRISTLERAHDASATPRLRAIDEKPR